MVEIYFNNDASLLNDQNYADFGTQENTDEYFCVKTYVQNNWKKLYKNKNLKLYFQQLYFSIVYYLHKRLRQYFLHGHYSMLDNLFRSFEPGESTLQSLFDDLESFAFISGPLSLFDIYNNPNPFYDAPIDYWLDVIHEKKHFEIEKNRCAYLNLRKNEIQKSLKYIISGLKEVLNESSFFERRIKINYQNPNYLVNIFKIFSKFFFMPIFHEYTTLIKKALMTLPVIKEDGFDNLDDPVQLENFRRQLVVAGRLEFDEVLDRPKLKYESYTVFNVKNIRVVI